MLREEIVASKLSAMVLPMLPEEVRLDLATFQMAKVEEAVKSTAPPPAEVKVLAPYAQTSAAEILLRLLIRVLLAKTSVIIEEVALLMSD